MSKRGTQAQPAANAFGIFIQSLLHERRMTVSALAKAVGVTRTTIYKWLGEIPPKYVELSRLKAAADALGVEVEVLQTLLDGHVYVGRNDDLDARELLVRAYIVSTRDLTPTEVMRTIERATRAAEDARYG